MGLGSDQIRLRQASRVGAPSTTSTILLKLICLAKSLRSRCTSTVTEYEAEELSVDLTVSSLARAIYVAEAAYQVIIARD